MAGYSRDQGIGEGGKRLSFDPACLVTARAPASSASNCRAYKGASGALADLIGGQVDAMFATVPSISGHWKAGKLRAIAVTSEKRSPALPGVPTMNETLPGFEAESWVALLAPARTPSDIITRVHAETVKILAQPEMRERLGEQGLEAVGSTPAQADRWIRTQIERWGRVIREQKIVIE